MDIVERVKRSNQMNEDLEEFREQAYDGDDHWTFKDNLLLHDGRLVVADDGDLRARLLDEVYRLPASAYPGIKKTMDLLSSRYYWPEMVRDVQRYVENCRVYRRTKAWRDRPLGLL